MKVVKQEMLRIFPESLLIFKLRNISFHSPPRTRTGAFEKPTFLTNHCLLCHCARCQVEKTSILSLFLQSDREQSIVWITWRGLDVFHPKFLCQRLSSWKCMFRHFWANIYHIFIYVFHKSFVFFVFMNIYKCVYFYRPGKKLNQI